MDKYNFQFNWLDIPGKKRLMSEALQFQFSQTEKFSPNQISQLQFANLQMLVQHCTENVPYYKQRSYSKIKTWSDWHQLPLLGREDLQQHEESLHADIDMSSREGKTYIKRSSGSTGRPVKVLTNDRAQLLWQAATLRDHLWHKRDFSQKLAVIKYIDDNKSEPPGKVSRYWGPSSALLFSTGPAVTISSSTDISKQYEWLREQKPGYLLTYPSILNALSERNLRADNAIALLGITTIGENISPETRHMAERSFGGRVCDIYSCQEIGYIALQCPQHNHYHLQAETCFVEVLDDNNQVCRPGEMGRVVVTHLHNYSMPLVRYEIGDYAIAGGSCDCGINLPVVERIIGRTRNLVSYPNGKRNWPSYNPMKLMELLPNVQFQLIQKSLDTLLLRIGTNKPIDDEVFLQVKTIINEAMGYPFNIQLEQLQIIPRSKSGKYEEFLSEVDNV